MQHYTPTYGARETARHIRDFVRENRQAFWDILNPLLPYIIGLILFDFIVTATLMPSGEKSFGLGGLIAFYFYAALIISWHRVVIHGPDNYTPVNPFQPKKSELVFMGMMILVSLSGILGAALFLLLFVAFGPAAMVLGVFLGILLACWVGFRVCFYFPAKAVGSDITLKQAFDLTKGYFWKLVGATFLGSIRVFLALFGYLVGMGIIVGIIIKLSGGAFFIMHLLTFLMMLPVFIFFQPVITIIGVTALSNYYLHAVQNRPR